MKKALRQKGKMLRKNLSSAERAEKSKAIAKHLLESDLFQNAECIFSYLPIGEEADTMPVLEAAWKLGKKVAVPVCGRKREMFFFPIGSIMETTIGAYGIREPKEEREKEIFPQKGDLFLVPALLFDKKGFRLGYGGGYYDTYFAAHKVYPKIGYGFSCQIMEEDLPREKTDVAVDWIVTENGWLGGNV